MSTLAVGAIGVYRRYLSPIKGYRCAHNALHHHGSCSDFGLRVYGRLPILSATALMLRRLRDCRAAYEAVLTRTRSAAEHKQGHSRQDRRAGVCDTLDAIHCVTMPFPNAACVDIGVCDCLGGLF